MQARLDWAPLRSCLAMPFEARADVGDEDRLCAGAVASPAHQRHLGRGFRVAYHGRRIVGEDAGHGPQIADVAVDHAEEREDGRLVR